VLLFSGLQTQSPENGNIRESGRRLSGIFGLKVREWEGGNFSKGVKAGNWRTFSGARLEKILSRIAEWLAGAEGIEPPNGGIKSTAPRALFTKKCMCCVDAKFSGKDRLKKPF
jgi:hypothetical protein